MKTLLPNSNKTVRTLAFVAATVLLASSSVGQAASAQGYASGQSNYFASAGSEQDSLLPPEVVPLDPVAANKLMESQAQSRAANIDIPDMQSAPGMVTMDQPGAGMQTAQDARKAAFNQLMGQNQVAPINRSYQPQMPGGQMGPGGFPGAPGAGNPNFPYQPQMANNYPGPQGGAGGQTAQSGWMQPGQGGQQTLSGGVKYTQQRRDIRRAGLSNAVSAVAGLGTGLFLGSLVSRSYYSNPVGLGMMGLGMTGFGIRNGFRF